MVTTPIRQSEVSGNQKVDRTIKSDSTHDRDANGQQFTGGDKKEHGPMSDEQVKQAIEYLENLPSVKDSNWKIEPVMIGDRKFLLVKDSMGTVIRKIPEAELWTLPFDKDVRTGQLLKKAA